MMQADGNKRDISYIALEVSDQPDEKLVRMVSVANRRQVTAHLRDGWYAHFLQHPCLALPGCSTLSGYWLPCIARTAYGSVEKVDITDRCLTPVAVGDKLNLIASLDWHQGGLHAICNFSKGGLSTKSIQLIASKLDQAVTSQ